MDNFLERFVEFFGKFFKMYKMFQNFRIFYLKFFKMFWNMLSRTRIQILACTRAENILFYARAGNNRHAHAQTRSGMRTRIQILACARADYF
jgi:hypothetical protein